MIVIRHRTGSLAGKELQIEPRTDQITFGRDPAACDVVFPADETLVARRHFALVKKPSGEWTFDLFGDLFVAMNGQQVDQAQALHSGAKVELGRRGGPSFVVEVSGDTLPVDLPVTQTQQQVESSHVAARRARRYAIVGVLLAIVAGGGAAGVFYLQRSEGMRLSDAVAAVAEEQKRAAEQTISSDVKNKVMQAAYLVIMKAPNGRLRPAGTATPVAPDLLGTNAHIVEAFLSRKPDEHMYVRAPGHDGAVYEVIEARKHPGYDAFNSFVSKDPIYAIGLSNCPTCALPDPLSGSLSYDVGTLQVAAGSNLSPILGIASREDLAKLAPGSPLALAGYPTEDVQGYEVQPLAPTPNLSVGIITRMTDMFNVPTDVEHRFLIHHNLPITGGSSGSPMVGPSGKIVAFNNAENALSVPTSVIWTGRIPNAVLINYAQRADLMLDLQESSGSANVDGQRAYWTKMTEAFKRGIDVVVPAIVAALKPKPGMTADLVEKKSFTMTASNKIMLRNTKGQEVPVRQQKHTVNLTPGRQYLFIGYAEGRTALAMYLFANDKLVDKNEQNDWHPHVQYAPNQAGPVEINVLSPDRDATYYLFQYVWGGPSS